MYIIYYQILYIIKKIDKINNNNNNYMFLSYNRVTHTEGMMDREMIYLHFQMWMISARTEYCYEDMFCTNVSY